MISLEQRIQVGIAAVRKAVRIADNKRRSESERIFGHPGAFIPKHAISDEEKLRIGIEAVLCSCQENCCGCACDSDCQCR